MTSIKKLTYVFDAYCGWCFGFAPKIAELAERLGDNADIEVLPGGLFLGSRRAPIGTLDFLPSANERIAQTTGAEFGEPFKKLVEEGSFVMDSLDAATGFAALRSQAPTKSVEIAVAMQHAFYTFGLSLSDASTYRTIAKDLGLDADEAAKAFGDPDVRKQASADITKARELGANSFPTLFVHASDGTATKVGSPTSTVDELVAAVGSVA